MKTLGAPACAGSGVRAAEGAGPKKESSNATFELLTNAATACWVRAGRNFFSMSALTSAIGFTVCVSTLMMW